MTRDGRIPLPQVEPPDDAVADQWYVATADLSGPVPVLQLTPYEPPPPYVPPPATALVPLTTTTEDGPAFVWDDDDNLVMTEVEL